jgi:hypothetical protein
VKHRKCDQAKYRRRKEREKVNKTERMKRQRLIEAKWAAHRRKLEEERRRRQAELLPYRQQLVDVLARRLYQLSPYHASEARLKWWLQLPMAIFKRGG